jgi:superoxide dismutase
MDAGLRDFEMSRCEKKHVFCDACIVDSDGLEEFREKQQEEIDEEESKENFDQDKADELNDILCKGTVPSKFCPICSMDRISDDDLLEYLLKKNSLKKNDMPAKLKEEFGSYDNMTKFLDGE